MGAHAMSSASRIELGSRKFQAGAAAVAVATAAAITPVISHAAPMGPLAPVTARTGPVLTWGFDAVDPGLLARVNRVAPRGEAGANANATVTAGPTPGQLIRTLIQGIATGIQGVVRGVTVIVGTAAYVGLAFTGGVISAVGSILPGPLGTLLVGAGNAVNNIANALAEAIHVGPYATASV